MTYHRHLSYMYPEDHSINDAISSELCMLWYISVDQVVQAAIKLHQGAQLANCDIRAAYQIVPVFPQDRIWLGMKHNNPVHVYVDGCFQFGLRLAPKIFIVLVDTLELCIHKRGVDSIYHYLDEFVLAGPPESDRCFQIFEKECIVPQSSIITGKMEGPYTTITYPGITVDTWKNELPDEKHQHLFQAIAQ